MSAPGGIRPPWRLTCRSCGTLFEAPGALSYMRIRLALREAGWCWRGSQAGYVYYCTAHHPDRQTADA
ncbi:hypothetical protein [Streptomyces sp. cg35]|uniref:hypothetical protein n=1 Tax=Streptomyces sp. cg35 TaxID=3421650 RepID=UPI003D167F72